MIKAFYLLDRLLTFLVGLWLGLGVVWFGTVETNISIWFLMLLSFCWSLMPSRLLLGTAGKYVAGAGLLLSIIAIALYGFVGSVIMATATFMFSTALLAYSTLAGVDRTE